MDFVGPDAETPLLFFGPQTPQHAAPDYHSILKPRPGVRVDETTTTATATTTTTTTTVTTRTLGWSSTYILIISRVIGSGIFATPGAIVRSVGSVGLSLLLWVAGAVISWAGLAVALEYGCMLPRSGGQFPVFFSLILSYVSFLFSFSSFLGLSSCQSSKQQKRVKADPV
jgi:amino acid permease